MNITALETKRKGWQKYHVVNCYWACSCSSSCGELHLCELEQNWRDRGTRRLSRRLFWVRGESGSLSRLTSDLYNACVFVKAAQLPQVSVFLYIRLFMRVCLSKYTSLRLICDSNCSRHLTLSPDRGKTHSVLHF